MGTLLNAAGTLTVKVNPFVSYEEESDGKKEAQEDQEAESHQRNPAGARRPGDEEGRRRRGHFDDLRQLGLPLLLYVLLPVDRPHPPTLSPHPRPLSRKRERGVG